MQDQDTFHGFRLSPQQERLLSLPKNSLYRASCSVRLDGRLDAERLKAALSTALARHEAYRIAIRELPGSQHPVQVLLEKAAFTWQELDLRSMDKQVQMERITTLSQQEQSGKQQDALVNCSLSLWRKISICF